MLGSGFRFYLAHGTLTEPFAISSLLKADGTANTDGGATINDLIAGGTFGSVTIPANSIKLADELKDVTEAGNPNTINATTRSVARQGSQANEITTVSRDLSAQFVYEPHTAFRVPAVGYEVLDLLEYCEVKKLPIFVIDLDKVLGTTAASDGGRAHCANYTVAISGTREVENQAVYDITFALKNFSQRVEYDQPNALFKAIADP